MANIPLLESKLDQRQKEAVYLMLKNERLDTKDRRSQEAIAKEVGVTYKTLWEWKTKNQSFITYKNLISRRQLSEKMSRVDNKLFEATQADNVKAMELYYKLLGELTNKTQIETIDGSSNAKTAEEISKEALELQRLVDESEA